MKIFKTKTGFTLAEVLITLGIIGVVAAMTIPTLIANTRSQQYRAQFKKTLSTLNQAVRLNKANYGWDFADKLACCGDCTSSGNTAINDNPENKFSGCAVMNANLSGAMPLGIFDRNISIQHDYSNGQYVYALSDGAYISISEVDAFDSNGCSIEPGETIKHRINRESGPSGFDAGCSGYIDVNGEAGPNKEVKCSDGTATDFIDNDNSCVVNSADVTDIYPIIYYGSTVVPSTNAAAYVLQTAK